MKQNQNSSTDQELPFLPRLKGMGFLLLFFSLVAFSLALFEEEELLIEELEPETESVLSFNGHIAAGAFALVGTACLYCVHSKRKQTKKPPIL